LGGGKRSALGRNFDRIVDLAKKKGENSEKDLLAKTYERKSGFSEGVPQIQRKVAEEEEGKKKLGDDFPYKGGGRTCNKGGEGYQGAGKRSPTS